MLTQQPPRPMCHNCTKLPARPNGRSVRGFQRWHTLCNICAKQKYVKPPQKDTACGSCGFRASDPCQLDLVDGRTICACCHRLEIKNKNEQRRREREITVDATVDLNKIRL